MNLHRSNTEPPAKIETPHSLYRLVDRLRVNVKDAGLRQRATVDDSEYYRGAGHAFAACITIVNEEIEETGGAGATKGQIRVFRMLVIATLTGITIPVVFNFLIGRPVEYSHAALVILGWLVFIALPRYQETPAPEPEKLTVREILRQCSDDPKTDVIRDAAAHQQQRKRRTHLGRKPPSRQSLLSDATDINGLL